MIELTILEHLTTAMTVPVYLEHPDPAPTRYVIFQKTSSGKLNKLPKSTFAFQSYAESLYQAALLNEQLKEAVESLINKNEVSKVSLNADYNFTDITTKKYRYQAVFDIQHY